MNNSKTPKVCLSARNRSNREGFTLIELITVLTLGAIITGVVITTLASLFRFDRNVNQHIETRAELRRFSATLRTDLHQATSFQGDNENQILLIEQLDQKTIRYQIESGHWIRFTDQKNQPTVSTVYDLDNSLQCRCETTSASTDERVEISFSTATPTETPTPTKPAANQTERSLPISRSTIITTLGRDYDYFNP